jgi:hypothetical protein
MNNLMAYYLVLEMTNEEALTYLALHCCQRRICGT